ncbi:MAG TPA: TonB-dependent receptor [Candidatus Baltobacteraceae bacterium]|nr:TonB-dependent receptor [Candidatus Baltobacteraceae bacterium]
MARWLTTVISGAFIFSLIPVYAWSGTTGGITGRVVDAGTGAALPDVAVTITSASQTAATTSDSTGSYRFLSLAPDTYTLGFIKTGYTPVSQPGVTVFADQVQTIAMTMTPSLKTIANVRTRAANLVKSGTTSDVYSVNAAGALAAQGLVGPGGLNNAYGAIASVPGVSLDAGEQGWFQTVHVRGGDIDQVGYELDGIPVNRVYDNAPMTMLSSLGQQELQVYTGGTPASADAQGISGYINQVVKTGTFPGFGTADLGIGTPAFYHKASIEAGGSNPDRTFSYYIGLGGANQDFRYIDSSNGASQFSSFFYPVNLVDPNTFAPGPNGFVYVGNNTSPGVNNATGAGLFGPGITYGLTNTQQRDSIANLHFGIPHKHSQLRDDVQLLYLTSEVYAQYFSSQSDLGSGLANQLGQNVWDDSYLYNGPLMQPPNPAAVSTYLFPASPSNRPFDAPLPANQRDTNDNGVAVEKLQYQHAFSSSAFLRAYGYMLYSNWFIYGPNTAAQPFYGAELAQYEIPDHTSGFNTSFTDQLGSKNLLTASVGYTASNLQRYDIGYIHPNYNIANFVGTDGNCYEPTTGALVACYDQAYGAGTGCASVAFPSNCTGNIQNVLNNALPASAMPAGSPGALENAHWIATNNYFYSGSGAALNQVHTRFLGYSVTDQWRPNDALTINAGLRIEDFRYLFGDTAADSPARQFWFTHYNQEYCATPGTAPFFNGLGACPAGTVSPDLSNPGDPAPYTVARFQPRIGLTYSLNPDTVVRASFGVYARPPNSSWVQYNVVQTDLPLYMGNHFYPYGFQTPEHLIRPDTSYNYDLSLEQRLKGTDWSYKITPFYRGTKDQLQNFFIDPLGGLESGLNVGSQRSYGVELAVQKGDFSRNGLSGQISYTYTHSDIKYQNFNGSNINIIDQLNNYIKQYNSFTQAGGGAACYTFGGAGSPGTPAACGAGVTANPYYGQAPQPLLDRNAYYPTYDVIPGPVAGTNGYWVPNVASLILNYRTNKFAVTPSLTYSSGAEYGAPTVWPGYNPRSCSANLPGAANPAAADPASCDDLGALPLFIPDPFSGKFDNLGAFKEPWRLSMSLGLSYDVTPAVTARVNLVNIVDTCGQRGYAWDNPNVCVYGGLPSGFMYPAGNFYPNSFQSTPAPQLKYPYTFWLNNSNTGFVGVRVPMQVTFDLQVKL